jgi:hypothetical protein
MVLKLHIAGPLKKLAEMLAESSAAHTLLGVSGSNAAAAKIHYGYGEDEEHAESFTDHMTKPLPRMLLALADFRSTKGTTSSWSTIIEIDVMIETLTLEEDRLKSTSERYMAFLERVEAVSDSLREMAATGTRLNITEITTLVQPQQADTKKTRSIGEVWWTVFRVTAGG